MAMAAQETQVLIRQLKGMRVALAIYLREKVAVVVAHPKLAILTEFLTAAMEFQIA
jgi:hypothetical protein